MFALSSCIGGSSSHNFLLWFVAHSQVPEMTTLVCIEPPTMFPNLHKVDSLAEVGIREEVTAVRQNSVLLKVELGFHTKLCLLTTFSKSK
jgi:hypothetical protein